MGSAGKKPYKYGFTWVTLKASSSDKELIQELYEELVNNPSRKTIVLQQSESPIK